MFILGHLGFGRLLVRPWRRNFPWTPLAVGMLLPDLIDKPLYYLHISPFFSCTRTVGHTAILALVLAAIAYARRSPAFAALAVGMATHLLIDNLFELALGASDGSAWIAASWPLHGWSFYQVSFTLSEHVGRLISLPTIVTDVVGLGLLVWERFGGSARQRISVRSPRR